MRKRKKQRKLQGNDGVLSVVNEREINQYNILFVSLVVDRYISRLQDRGDIELNHMLQERGDLTAEESFALIADAIREGVLIVDRANGKAVSIEKRIQTEIRDHFAEQIPQMQSQVVSEKWLLRRPLRSELTVEELVSFEKNCSRGRLKNVANPDMMIPAMGGRSIVSCLESVVRKTLPQNQVSDPSDELRDMLIETMRGPLDNLAKMCKDSDFVFMVEKSGSKVIPRFKVITRDKKTVDVDWSQI